MRSLVNLFAFLFKVQQFVISLILCFENNGVVFMR